MYTAVLDRPALSGSLQDFHQSLWQLLLAWDHRCLPQRARQNACENSEQISRAIAPQDATQDDVSFSYSS